MLRIQGYMLATRYPIETEDLWILEPHEFFYSENMANAACRAHTRDIKVVHVKIEEIKEMTEEKED